MRTGKKVVGNGSLSINTEARTIPVECIERRIDLLREQKVMLDSDLAALYQVTASNLNLAGKRNLTRFPADFMFQLTENEAASLLLQIAIATRGRGGRRTPPYAFTELGVAMLSSVLNSERAVQINFLIMRSTVILPSDATGAARLIPYGGYIAFIPLGGYYADIPYRRYAVDYVARTPAQLGPILKSIRIERGLTQQEAGAKVGLKQSTVSAIESDSARTSVDTLYKLLSALDLELVVRGKPSDHGTAGNRKQEW